MNSYLVGGTEVQVLELLRGMMPRYRPLLATQINRGHLLEVAEAMGITSVEFSLKGGVGQPNTLRQIGRLVGYLRENQVRLIHAHDFYSAVTAVPASRIVGAKVIMGRLDLAHWPSPPQRVLLTALTRAADHVVTNAQAIKDQLVRVERLPPSRISVIPNGMDASRFDELARQPLRAPLPELSGRTVIVHVANMSHPVKAQEDLLEAMRQVVPDHPQALLLLIGDGGRRPVLETLTFEYGLERHVAFLGHRMDVPAILMRAHVGVLCSLAEGMSNAIMEGMAAGLPMVVTDVGGSPELVRDGERGFVVAPRAPHQLAGKLRALLGCEQLRRQMGRAARDFIERELSVERLVARHEALYQRLLTEGAPVGEVAFA